MISVFLNKNLQSHLNQLDGYHRHRHCLCCLLKDMLNLHNLAVTKLSDRFLIFALILSADQVFEPRVESVMLRKLCCDSWPMKLT